MIASNSFCKPRSAAAEPTSQTCSMAKSQAQSAVNMKSDTFTRRTGTPTFFAALASPPTAKIQFPKRVCVSRYEEAMAMNAHQRMALGMPRTSGLPSSRVAIQPCFPAQVKSSFANVPENRKRTTGSCAARSPMPLTMAPAIEADSGRPITRWKVDNVRTRSSAGGCGGGAPGTGSTTFGPAGPPFVSGGRWPSAAAVCRPGVELPGKRESGWLSMSFLSFPRGCCVEPARASPVRHARARFNAYASAILPGVLLHLRDVVLGHEPRTGADVALPVHRREPVRVEALLGLRVLL